MHIFVCVCVCVCVCVFALLFGTSFRIQCIPYLFGFKTEDFPFQNNPKNLNRRIRFKTLGLFWRKKKHIFVAE